MTDYAIRLILASLRYVKLVIACVAAKQPPNEGNESTQTARNIAAFVDQSSSEPDGTHAPDGPAKEAKGEVSRGPSGRTRKPRFEERLWSLDSSGFAVVLIFVLFSIFSIAAISVNSDLMGMGA